MNIALIGYGKMGKTIEQFAVERGHTIVSIIDVNNRDDFDSQAFKSADVAIEFTTPDTAFDNYMKCFAAGVSVVSGTTGWLDRLEDVKKMCKDEGQTFFYASNFSIGVNIFFALNKYLAKVMDRFPAYDVNLTETHHIHKLDAPSGTAITLAEGILDNVTRKKSWTLGDAASPSDISVRSIREGEVPGTHEIVYESDVDYISIKHHAKNRAGLALGAVVAAEFTAGKKGFLTMDDIFTF
ncbi:4-hydroxy-tetrahydrodipicolinate reductase [Parabacteroides sp. PF5-5]|uniref:4-hydroxy-tetrahydrodipicolinate reductase n=1 Tax=unclassified Parabacteroides TaxID=2649774 RepID=UPI00247502F7|nr:MULTISPECIES: 4-hydroxy-tetrahydrodipicolinate reductase [unclassified Parabacteroides]MDH6305075.1 4-hydroxy-tetrahydrodipicolinate reductase [Parabacteroides sp. PH5-39]MDH6315840.1 4-hydroxy-tetrahydrodipicolinate reductase [Parabacteroides sp. PF5-13]MDH6319497.1 4-hydroxy-tetrahydrodipicolinate reductase [Parabacteroides sp. PH5-13]MDH6323228.1 4-hydroxy-tetrahydrodipicolinate reductase [Parabacteroides sp. PH5-8]MDH6327264.1 4-hydroxy-tetrahydrodipicolinate reductase [Parabacteroides 